METITEKSFLESRIYKYPELAFVQVIDRLDVDPKINQYLKTVLSSNPKAVKLQETMKEILDGMMAEGQKEEAGLLFNIHRTLTEFSGYGANDKASSDVEACFGGDFEIPEEGVIVVDYFVVRNLPRVIELCEERGIDLSRIQVCVPKGVFAAQLMRMTKEKKHEFETAVEKLNESQFLIDDVNHNADINIDEDIAVWFSPRTMPICPRLHAETEEQTIENYCTFFSEKVANVVKGGRVFANLAYSTDWEALTVEDPSSTKDRKGRHITKINGMSKSVAVAVSKALTFEGFTQKGKDEFNPADVNAEIDHAKLAKGLDLVKTAN